IHRPVARVARVAEAPPPSKRQPQAVPAVPPPIPNEPPRHVVTTTGEPLVSCIMPTYNRRRFIPQAIRNFLRQNYSNLELVIVDDGAESATDCMPADPCIRYFHLDRKLTIGAKRNIACTHARGDLIAHWDDDDWYASSRIRTQVDALHKSTADV